jgi:hypothetical protein
MAVRVRKLAKEMNRDVWDVLGLLHAIGFVRYRSPDDMLPDGTVEKVKRAERDGVEPVRVERSTPTPAGGRSDLPAAANDDLMSRLVPGVTRSGAPAKPQPKPTPLPAGVVPRAPKPPEAPAVPLSAVATPGAEAQKAVLAAERAAVAAEAARVNGEAERLAGEAERLTSEAERLRQEKAALEAERAALAEERLRLVAERDQLVDEKVAAGGVSLLDVLAARGLRGQDEAERALAALSHARLLGDLAQRLRVDDPEAAERWLREKLVLVGGAVPEGLGTAAVTVAPDRADLPDAASLGKRLTRLGERLLLNGVRRALLVGGRPLWQRQLRAGLDARIETRFAPGATRTRAEAEQDVSRTDLVVLWGVNADSGAMELYRSARPMLVQVGSDDLIALLDALEAALEG